MSIHMEIIVYMLPYHFCVFTAEKEILINKTIFMCNFSVSYPRYTWQEKDLFFPGAFHKMKSTYSR